MHRSELMGKRRDLVIKLLFFALLLVFSVMMYLESRMVIDIAYFIIVSVLFIKFLSGLYVKEIYCLIDRLNKIIQKGFSKEMYWNSYMISDNHNLLFISLPKEKYNIEFIGFISNVFMCYFKLNNVLSIISYSVDKENYELDFAMCEYDNINEHIYKEAITEGYADVWKKGGIDEKI